MSTKPLLKGSAYWRQLYRDFRTTFPELGVFISVLIVTGAFVGITVHCWWDVDFRIWRTGIELELKGRFDSMRMRWQNPSE